MWSMTMNLCTIFQKGVFFSRPVTRVVEWCECLKIIQGLQLSLISDLPDRSQYWKVCDSFHDDSALD